MNQNTNDKSLMEDLLLLEKGGCDLYMHGAIESSTANVHSAFGTALNDSLCMQDKIYTKMSDNGWYTNKSVEQTKIDNLKQKFSDR